LQHSSSSPSAATAAQAVTEINWWHAMTGANNDRVNNLAKRFNESQSEYKVNAVFKGSYPEAMAGAIAAYRAGNAPHILQVFEVGTATMMAAKGAIKPVYEVMSEAGEKFDPNVYVPRSPATTPTPRGRCCRSRSTARRRCSGTTRTRSRRPASTRTARRRRGPRSSPRWRS
jgi:sn-glycerol 3-phosphate transport system substrate-binding protein